MKCAFCKGKCDGKLILRNPIIQSMDSSDIVLCKDCLNLYANQEFEELQKRMELVITQTYL